MWEKRCKHEVERREEVGGAKAAYEELLGVERANVVGRGRPRSVGWGCGNGSGGEYKIRKRWPVDIDMRWAPK